MNFKTLLLVLLLIPALPLTASAKKKKGTEKGMIEKMEAVPCGAKQRGLAGLGSFWGSVGVTDVHSHELLCPQYLLRTDEMDYQIRPKDLKHAKLLPVGTEGEFKLKKNEILLAMPEGTGDHSMHAYQVVAMTPNNTNPDEGAEKKSSSLRSDER